MAFGVHNKTKQGKVAENLLSEGIEDWAGYLSLSYFRDRHTRSHSKKVPCRGSLPKSIASFLHLLIGPLTALPAHAARAVLCRLNPQ